MRNAYKGLKLERLPGQQGANACLQVMPCPDIKRRREHLLKILYQSRPVSRVLS